MTPGLIVLLTALQALHINIEALYKGCQNDVPNEPLFGTIRLVF